MATDPGMLQSWYNDYTKDNGAATSGMPATTTAAPAPAQAGMLASTAAAPAPAAAPTPFKPAQAATTEWKPDANSTVAGQVNKLTAAGSPLIDQATTAAKQQSASRGLLNSTMGITAGLDAAYRAVLPIAQQDANINASAGQANAGAANSTAQFNANSINQSGMKAYDAAVSQSLQGADNENRLQLAALDAGSRNALMELEAKYKGELQASQSMAASYQSMVDGISRIMVSPDLDEAAKQKAIGNLTTLYNNALQMQSVVSGLNLGELLAPDAVGGTPAPAPGAAPAPAPTPAPAPPLFDWNSYNTHGA